MFYLSMLLAIHSDVHTETLDDGFEYHFAIVYREFVARFDEDSLEVSRLIDIVDCCGFVSTHNSTIYSSQLAMRITKHMLRIMKESSDAWKRANERSEELDRSTQALQMRLRQQTQTSINDRLAAFGQASRAVSRLKDVESIEPVFNGSNVRAIHSVTGLVNHVTGMISRHAGNRSIIKSAVCEVQTWGTYQRMSMNSSLDVAETQDELCITQAKATVAQEDLDKTKAYYQGMLGRSRLPY